MWMLVSLHVSQPAARRPTGVTREAHDARDATLTSPYELPVIDIAMRAGVISLPMASLSPPQTRSLSAPL